MFSIIFWIVIGTSIWVAYDSQANKVPVTKSPYSINNGALAWFLSCILLWIVSFPYYLSRRSQVVRERNAEKSQAKESINEELIKCPYCAELIKKEAKICRFCNSSLVIPKKLPQPKKSKGLKEEEKEVAPKLWVIEEPKDKNL